MTELNGRVIWSLARSGMGTTLSANGSSNPNGWQGSSQTAITPVDLRWTDDLEMMAYVTGKTGSPVVNVGLGIYDDVGNLYQPSALAMAITLTSVPSSNLLAVGRHAGSAGTYITLPDWGQVYWTVTGGSVTGVEIELYGR